MSQSKNRSSPATSSKKTEVPAGRIKRALKLGGIAAGLAGDAGLALKAIGRDVGAEFHRRAAERLLVRLGELKGLPMKLGEMLSYVDDMVPPEHRRIYRDTLAALRIRSRPMSFASMSEVLIEELGPIESRFGTFLEEPIAADPRNARCLIVPNDPRLADTPVP